MISTTSYLPFHYLLSTSLHLSSPLPLHVVHCLSIYLPSTSSPLPVFYSWFSSIYHQPLCKQLPRLLHWRYLVPMVCVFGGLYSYEWLAWTPRSKEAALKRQIIQHMRDNIQLQVKAINNSCIFQMQGKRSIHHTRQMYRITTE